MTKNPHPITRKGWGTIKLPFNINFKYIDANIKSILIIEKKLDIKKEKDVNLLISYYVYNNKIQIVMDSIIDQTENYGKRIKEMCMKNSKRRINEWRNLITEILDKYGLPGWHLTNIDNANRLFEILSTANNQVLAFEFDLRNIDKWDKLDRSIVRTQKLFYDMIVSQNDEQYAKLRTELKDNFNVDILDDEL